MEYRNPWLALLVSIIISVIFCLGIGLIAATLTFFWWIVGPLWLFICIMFVFSVVLIVG